MQLYLFTLHFLIGPATDSWQVNFFENIMAKKLPVFLLLIWISTGLIIIIFNELSIHQTSFELIFNPLMWTTITFISTLAIRDKKLFKISRKLTSSLLFMCAVSFLLYPLLYFSLPSVWIELKFIISHSFSASSIALIFYRDCFQTT